MGSQRVRASDGISRRDLLRSGGMLLVGVAGVELLAACTIAPASSGPAASAGATGASGAQAQLAPQIIFGTPLNNVKVPNPGVVINGNACTYFWPSYDSLTATDPLGNLNPALASSWKLVDPKTWEFKLRTDIKFHDGTPLEAADVEKTYAYYRDPKNTLPITTQIFNSIESVTAPDSSTVRITTKDVDPTLPKSIALAMVLQGRRLEKDGAEAFFKTPPSGTGPYKWISADFNTSLKWDAMPADFVSPRGRASAQKLEMRFITEAAGIAAALRSGDIDIAERLPIDAAKQLQTQGYPVVMSPPGGGMVSFVLQPLRGPTQDVRVRQAINYAVDKDSIVKNIYGGFAEADGQLIGKGFLGNNTSVAPYPYDPAKATALLAEAGFPNGFDMTMMVYQNNSTAGELLGSAVAAFLKAVKINVKINPTEIAVGFRQNTGPSADRQDLSVIIYSASPSFEGYSAWNLFSVTEVPMERGGRWADKTFDQLYQSAKREPDDAKRAALYQQAAKYLHDQAPVLFLCTQPLIAVTQKNIRHDPGYAGTRYTSGLAKSS
jgi:ABC-type transport system substrate-binding protein